MGRLPEEGGGRSGIAPERSVLLSRAASPWWWSGDAVQGVYPGRRVLPAGAQALAFSHRRPVWGAGRQVVTEQEQAACGVVFLDAPGDGFDARFVARG